MSIVSLIIASKYTRAFVRGPTTYYLHTSSRHLQSTLFRQSELQAHHKRAVPYKQAQFINTQPRKKLAHEFDYLPTADEMDAQDVQALAEDMQHTLDISNNDNSLEGKVACTCGKGASPVNSSGNNDLIDAKPKKVLRTPLKSDFSVIDKDANMPKYTLQAIGTMESCFKEKNGTPRQGWLAPMSRAKLTLQLQNNKSHSLEGLEDFSHIWLIFMFSLNKASKPKYKVQPPRLDGDRVGVFSTRSPHRPNSIGITLAKIESIDFKEATIHLSGIDLVESTPILDIKPYIPDHDSIPGDVSIPDWITAPTITDTWDVEYSPRADHQLDEILAQKKLQFYKDADSIKTLIKQVLATEPRSMYRRIKTRKWDDGQFGFCVDILNVIAVYSDDDDRVRIIEIQDWSDHYTKKRTKYVAG